MNEARRVTPLAGVWIEIAIYRIRHGADWVTPLAGVWIEIPAERPFRGLGYASLPLRECGLKSAYDSLLGDHQIRHSPCGSVD